MPGTPSSGAKAVTRWPAACGSHSPVVRAGGEDPGADFVDVVSFGYTATACADFLAKGRQIGVTGRLHQSEWTTKSGEPRTRLEVIPDNVEFLDRPQRPAEVEAGA